MNAEELKKRIDELALEFAKTHDEEVKAELEALRGRVAAMKGRLMVSQQHWEAPPVRAPVVDA